MAPAGRLGLTEVVGAGGLGGGAVLVRGGRNDGSGDPSPPGTPVG
jgi:hypothetical protein